MSATIMLAQPGSRKHAALVGIGLLQSKTGGECGHKTGVEMLWECKTVQPGLLQSNLSMRGPQGTAGQGQWELAHFSNHSVEEDEGSLKTASVELCDEDMYSSSVDVTTPEGCTAFYLTRLAGEADVLDLSQLRHCETSVPLGATTCPTRAAAIVHTKLWLQERVTQYRDAHYGLHIGTSKTVYAGSSDLAAVYAWTKSESEWAMWAEIRVQICTRSDPAQVSLLLAHT